MPNVFQVFSDLHVQICNMLMQVSVGFSHAAVVLNDGSVYTFGDGENGKLGLGEERADDSVPRLVSALGGGISIQEVSCGQQHTGFVCEAGNGWTCGLGLHGQLGHGVLDNETSPRRIALSGNPRFSSISCGEVHTLLLQVWRKMSTRAFPCRR